MIGVPYRIRTGVAAVRGRCPGPLDEGDEACAVLSSRSPPDQARESTWRGIVAVITIDDAEVALRKQSHTDRHR